MRADDPATATTAFCGTLSKQDILKLKKARISDAVIIHQIEKDGVNFAVDPAVILELKKAGFSDDVLNALVLASKPAQPTIDNSTRILYDSGKYTELADQLKAMLKVNPDDYKSRALLVTVFLRLNDVEDAKTELVTLASAVAAEARRYAATLQKLVDLRQQQQVTQQQLALALQERRTSDVSILIDSVSASPLQKGILYAYFDLFRADFDGARSRVNGLTTASAADQQQLKALSQDISERETTYSTAMARVEAHLHSPLTPSTCINTFLNSHQTDFHAISIPEYMNAVSTVSDVAPLDNKSMDLLFHAELMMGRYEELERLGDAVLKAKGNIRMPFYSATQYFTVVIDKEHKRFFTEPDQHPFSVRYPATAGWGGWKPSNSNGRLLELVPFNVAFDEVSEISQKAKSAGWVDPGIDMLAGKPYAIAIKPKGVAPNYALMEFLHCTAGGAAQLTATHNLGQFIAHVIGHDVKTNLVDVDKSHHPAAWSSATMTMYGGYQAGRGNTQLAQAISTFQLSALAQGEVSTKTQRETWYQMMSTKPFSFDVQQSFAEIDRLLGLL